MFGNVEPDDISVPDMKRMHIRLQEYQSKKLKPEGTREEVEVFLKERFEAAENIKEKFSMNLILMKRPPRES